MKKDLCFTVLPWQGIGREGESLFSGSVLLRLFIFHKRMSLMEEIYEEETSVDCWRMQVFSSFLYSSLLPDTMTLNSVGQFLLRAQLWEIKLLEDCWKAISSSSSPKFIPRSSQTIKELCALGSVREDATYESCLLYFLVERWWGNCQLDYTTPL